MTNEVPKAGAYGEPWNVEQSGRWVCVGPKDLSLDELETRGGRAFACVNALSGRNPAKLSDLEDAIAMAIGALKAASMTGEVSREGAAVVLGRIEAAARAFGTIASKETGHA